jgi:transposase
VVDLLQATGARVHLADPQGLNWGQRCVKNDERDAIDLADVLRLGRLPEAWMAPPATRELWELVRYRAKLVGVAVGAQGPGPCGDGQRGGAVRAGPHVRAPGNAQLDAAAMSHTYRTRVESLRDLIELYDREVAMLEGEIHRQLRCHCGYRAIPAIDGVGRTIAAVLVAEIGDVGRFGSAQALCSWPGLTPKHRQSDTKTTRGSITKQGSRLVRWALIEAVARDHGEPGLAAGFRRLAQRRGTNKGAGGGGPQGPHARLLRPAPRRDPLYRPGPRRRETRTRPDASP